MNYALIYQNFILDRQEKQPSKPDYFERHHIVPKALGGTDDKSNLIDLTPEDHFFAHLLLAKIHGGRMWIAVKAMSKLVNKKNTNRESLKLRCDFGFVRRNIANAFREMFSGPDGGKADKSIYTLKSFSGEVVSGNRFELSEKTSLTRQRISALLLGAKKTANNWYFEKHNPDGLTKGELRSLQIRDQEIHNLYHFDGREWKGTKIDFKNEFGSRLYFQSKHGNVLGWHKTKDDSLSYHQRIKEKSLFASQSRGDISGDKNPMFGLDRRKGYLVHLQHKSGKEYKGCTKDFADEMALSRYSYQSFIKIINGKRFVEGYEVKSFHGWRLINFISN
jgi:hypothetical protein